jgi:hypothetical protein
MRSRGEPNSNRRDPDAFAASVPPSVAPHAFAASSGSSRPRAATASRSASMVTPHSAVSVRSSGSNSTIFASPRRSSATS